MRIIPLPLLSRLMRLYFKGGVASFFFSFLVQTPERLAHFMGGRIRNSFHMTRVPISPGFGVFFQQSSAGLNAYLSHAEGVLAEDEVKAIIGGLESGLGG
jgi:hypothetical protein